MGKEVLTARQRGSPLAPKRKFRAVDGGDDDEQQNGSAAKRQTRSQSRRVAQSTSPSIYEVSDSENEQKPSAKRPVNDGKVECPICQARMKEEEVSPHIDRVHSEPTTNSAPTTTMFGLQRGIQVQPNDVEAKTPEPLSALSYNLMNEAALRKKFTTLGIPNQGNKQSMIRRHQEWMNIWNANCDSSKPRAKRDLLRDLDVWERTQGSQARGNNDHDGIMSKDFDGTTWARTNDDDFKQLIARARAQKNSKQSVNVDSTLPERPAERPAELPSIATGNGQVLDSGQADSSMPNGVT